MAFLPALGGRHFFSSEAMTRTARVAIAMASGFLLGCGHGATAPDARFPDAAGTYQMHGTFDGLPETEAQLSGSFTLVQASRNDPALTGSSSVVARMGTSAGTLGGFQAASIQDGGIVTFYLQNPGMPMWKFTGILSGNVISGSHVVLDANNSYPGSFTATRP